VDKSVSRYLSAKVISSQRAHLVVQLNFSPFKPIAKCKTDIILVGASGCRWKIPVSVQADPPNIDDTIVLESNMHEVSELTFKLTNTNKHSCAFKAYLEDTSDIVFDVEPKRGILEPYGRAGTNFRITFKPVEVFIRYKGMVIIETE
jgi:hypothetical protein